MRPWGNAAHKKLPRNTAVLASFRSLRISASPAGFVLRRLVRASGVKPLTLLRLAEK
jgi:hypothetical protein